MTIRIAGNKEELEKAVRLISKITDDKFTVSKLYPNRGNKEYRIYLSNIHFDPKK